MKRLRHSSLFILSAILFLSLLLSACQPLVAPTPTPAEETEAAAAIPGVDEYLAAYEAVEPAPLPSQFDEDGMTYDEAYDFQEALVAQMEAEGAQQVGYKLGLTGPKRPFGAEEPLYGRMLDFMVLENGAQVPASDFVKPLGEWEIAYFFDKDVLYPVTVEELQDAVGQIAPAVELPDLVFADMKNLTWLDLIASDIAPRRVVIGDKVSDDDFDENAIAPVTTLDGEVISEGIGSAVMGDQWEALRFLAEKLNERGEQIHAGDFVISGAMNPLTPLEPGSYTVDYGPFGVITFEIGE